MCSSVDIVDELSGNGQRRVIVAIDKASCIEAHTLVTTLLITGGTHINGTNCPWRHGDVMLLMSMYVVTMLVFTVTIVIQGHTCDDLTEAHGGGYDVVMLESMEPKNICSYNLNDHPNRHLLEREGWPD